MMPPETNTSHWNRVDWAIIFLLIVGLIGGSFFLSTGKTTDPEKKYLCLIQLERVEKAEFQYGGNNAVAAGDPLQNQNGTLHFGTVKEVTVKPSKSPCLQNGNVTWREEPNYLTVNVLTEITANDEEANGIRSQQVRFAGGETGNFRLGNYCGNGAKILWIREETNQK